MPVRKEFGWEWNGECTDDVRRELRRERNGAARGHSRGDALHEPHNDSKWTLEGHRRPEWIKVSMKNGENQIAMEMEGFAKRSRRPGGDRGGPKLHWRNPLHTIFFPLARKGGGHGGSERWRTSPASPVAHPIQQSDAKGRPNIPLTCLLGTAPTISIFPPYFRPSVLPAGKAIIMSIRCERGGSAKQPRLDLQ
jgi:hypothetical protein